MEKNLARDLVEPFNKTKHLTIQTHGDFAYFPPKYDMGKNTIKGAKKGIECQKNHKIGVSMFMFGNWKVIVIVGNFVILLEYECW